MSSNKCERQHYLDQGEGEGGGFYPWRLWTLTALFFNIKANAAFF